jgi:uncharacterized DUF497 family protein
MNTLRFEWDSDKDLANQKKHGVSFDEAKTVFYDPTAKVIADPQHSDAEDRFVIMGQSSKSRLLLVCHCFRENDDVIRLISARKAVPNERKNYER